MMQITTWGEAIMTSLTQALVLFLNAIPKVIGFIIIVAIGWALSSLVAKGVSALLRSVRFNELAYRSGFGGFVEGTGVDTDASGFIALITKWFIRLIALVVAFDALGLPAVSDVLRQLLLWLPNVVVALAVLVNATLVPSALSDGSVALPFCGPSVPRLASVVVPASRSRTKT